MKYRGSTAACEDKNWIPAFAGMTGWRGWEIRFWLLATIGARSQRSLG